MDRQSRVCKKAQVYSSLWVENILKEKNRCFVKLEDFYKLEKQYQKLLSRYVRKS